MGVREMDTCCLCCCRIIAGCRVLSVLFLVADAVGFLGNVAGLLKAFSFSEKYSETLEEHFQTDVVSFLVFVVILLFVWKVVAIVSDILLVIAFFNKKPKLALPWLVITFAFTVVWTILAFSLGVWLFTVEDGASAGLLVILFGVLLVDAVIGLAWIHVLGGYYALKEEVQPKRVHPFSSSNNLQNPAPVY